MPAHSFPNPFAFAVLIARHFRCSSLCKAGAFSCFTPQTKFSFGLPSQFPACESSGHFLYYCLPQTHSSSILSRCPNYLLNEHKIHSSWGPYLGMFSGYSWIVVKGCSQGCWGNHVVYSGIKHGPPACQVYTKVFEPFISPAPNTRLFLVGLST